MNKTKELNNNNNSNKNHNREDKQRVKLYRLTPQGGWLDLGTGYVFVTKQSPYYLSMINERSKEIIFKFSLSSKAKFHLQRNTIITWKENNDCTDDNLALSFQEYQGVKDIWRSISAIKGKDAEQIKDLNDDVSIDNLPFICREIQPTSDAAKVKLLLSKIKLNDCLFIKQLGRILEEEDKENVISHCSSDNKAANTSMTTIHINYNSIEEKKTTSPNISSMAYLFVIMKNIIMMADADLLEILMSETFFNITFAALEYDIETQRFVKHRLYLNATAKFNDLISIEEKKTIEKIKVNYRLAYLRDTVLARFMEANSFTVVNKIIQMNNNDIIQAIITNDKYIERLIDLLLSNDLIIQNKAVMFVVEVMALSKELFQRITDVHESFFQSRLLQAIEFILMDKAVLLSNSKGTNDYDNDSLVMNNIIARSLDILSDFIIYMPYLIKDYLTNENINQQLGEEQRQSQTYCLFNTLTNLLTHTNDSNINSLIGQIIKLLINAYQDLEINQNSIIFTKCLNELASFLTYTNNITSTSTSASIATLKQIILDIFSYSLNQLKDHMQYWFIHNSIFNKVLHNINQSKVLTVSVIKFIKFVIETNNYNYHKTILLSECFDELFKLFALHKKKENMILSTIMSLFDSISKNSSSSNCQLIEHLFTNYNEVIYDMDNRRFFGNLIKRHEIGLDYVTGEISRNESIGFHGLFSKEINSSSKEEEYDDIEIEGAIKMKENCNKKSNIIIDSKGFNISSSSSFLNLKDNLILKSSNASTPLSLLNQKRRGDPI